MVPMGKPTHLWIKTLYLRPEKPPPNSQKTWGGGHSKPRGANAVCKQVINNSNIKRLLTLGKQLQRWPHYVSGFVHLVLWTSKDSKQFPVE